VWLYAIDRKLDFAWTLQVDTVRNREAILDHPDSFFYCSMAEHDHRLYSEL